MRLLNSSLIDMRLKLHYNALQVQLGKSLHKELRRDGEGEARSGGSR